MDDEKNDAPVPGQDSVEPKTKGLDAAEQTELRDDTPMDAPADTGSDAEPTPEETVKMPAADASDSSGVSEPKTDPVPKDSSKSPTDGLKRIPKWGYAVGRGHCRASLCKPHDLLPRLAGRDLHRASHLFHLWPHGRRPLGPRLAGCDVHRAQDVQEVRRERR